MRDIFQDLVDNTNLTYISDMRDSKNFKEIKCGINKINQRYSYPEHDWKNLYEYISSSSIENLK